MPLSSNDAADQDVVTRPTAPDQAAGLGSPGADDAVRLIYVDADDDLPMMLDRLEEAAGPAILVLPDNCRAVHGVVAARLLVRRANAAGIDVVAVTSDRVSVAQLQREGVPCYGTVGEARTGRALQAARAAPQGARGLGRQARAVPGSSGMPSAADDEEKTNASSPPARSAREAPPELIDDVIDIADDQPDAVRAQAAPGAQPVDDRSELLAPYLRHSRRRWPFRVILGMLCLVAAGAAWAAFFPFATVSIVYSPRPFDRTYQATVGSANLDNIPLYHTRTTQSLTTDVAGTGTLLVPDGRAKGTVTLANTLQGVVDVPAGTTVSTQTGLSFTTLQTVSLPGAVSSFSGVTNGKSLVPVQATTAGTESNVGAGTITVVQGRLAGVVMVTNSSALTGGSVRTELTLTQSDESAAVERAQHTLTTSEVAWLNQKYAQSPLRAVVSSDQTAGSETRFVRDGRPYARITISMTTVMAYLHADDVQSTGLRMARAALAGTSQSLIDGSTSVKVLQAQGTIPAQIGIRVLAQTEPALDRESLAASIAGKSVHDATAILDAAGRRAGWSATVSTDPPLVQRLPLTARLITIHLDR